MKTFVFDFYNLYIPKGTKYTNKSLGITIKPLKLAEEFENKRTTFSAPYYREGWKTAKCFIKAKNAEDAKKIAYLLERLYSFAQSRSVFFVRWYEYKDGKKHWASESKFIEPKENRFSELIHGISTHGALYTSDISPFFDISLKTLSELSESKRTDLLTLMRALHISDSEMVWELRYLDCWIALEKMANQHYSDIKSKQPLFTSTQKAELKKKISQCLDNIMVGNQRLNFMKRSLARDYLYEHDTSQKMCLYLLSLDLGFDKKKLGKMLEKLIQVRTALVHNLNSEKLSKHPELLFYLQKITEVVILRLLGITRAEQSRYILHQYNRGNEL